MAIEDFDTGFATQDVDAIRRSLDGVDVSAERVSRSLTRAFAGAVAGGKSLDDTLRNVALSLSNVALSAGLKPLQQGLSSALSSLGSSIGGGNIGAIPVTPFADGGVVSRPTFFGAGGGLGLMGERGAEAIMPLARGPDGRLGVAASGGGSGATHVNVNITTPDVAGFQRSQVQIAGALARAVARGRRGS
jgi:phage-related minor tail protein